ncbi:MAG: UDP-N-acetylmuramyl peptide synthase [Propionibacterium sp.]|nr:MAG: UDP-N-acetylmuramyl peptide synthase [Propionibacterium sp.]
MQQFSAKELATLINSRLIGDPEQLVGADVVIDSRKVTPGCLFVAIVGENFDGHDFVSQAVASGAAAVMVDRELEITAPQLIVTDTVAGLSELAKGIVAKARAESGLISLGITGSSGKTSTKDLLSQILTAAGNTVSPPGSLNNEIGVPITCCRVDHDTDYLINEMGARGIGHISWLTSIVPPDIALVLNVGVAHLGEFGGVEQITKAKGELVEAVPEDGWAILNADDTQVAKMATITKAKIGWFAVDKQPEISAELVATAEDIELDRLARPSFTLRMQFGGEVSSYPISLQLSGRHQVANAAAAAAAALAAGVAPEKIAVSLNRAKAQSVWRMAITQRSDGSIIINDAYNANPESMAVAVQSLHHMVAEQQKKYPKAKGIAVLGDMLELGEESAKWHHKIGASLRIDEVFAIGEYAEDIIAGARSSGIDGKICEHKDILSLLQVQPGDVVLLKASRGIGLEAIAGQLVEGVEL